MIRILFLLCIPVLACCQVQTDDWAQHQEDYKHVVKKFYDLLYSGEAAGRELALVYWDASLDSGTYEKIKPYVLELTQGLSKEEIFKIIDSGEVSDEGLQFGLYIELSFAGARQIYFELGSKDLPVIIQSVWLSDGTLLGNKLRHELPYEKLLLVGGVNDKDGFTYVRDKPSKGARVVDTLMVGEYFYYVPNSNSDWWEISRSDNTKDNIGYIHKSRVLKYSALPNELKSRVIESRNLD